MKRILYCVLFDFIYLKCPYMKKWLLIVTLYKVMCSIRFGTVQSEGGVGVENGQMCCW